MLQGKVWVWGQGGASAEQDSKLVKPALIAELEEQWPPRGHDRQPWDIFGAQYIRDLPYGRPKLTSCSHTPEAATCQTPAVHLAARFPGTSGCALVMRQFKAWRNVMALDHIYDFFRFLQVQTQGPITGWL